MNFLNQKKKSFVKNIGLLQGKISSLMICLLKKH